MKKLLTTLHDRFCFLSSQEANEKEIADCYHQLKETIGTPERKLVLRIIDSKDRIIEVVSLDSFICGFRLAWRLSSELRYLDQTVPLQIGRDVSPQAKLEHSC